MPSNFLLLKNFHYQLEAFNKFDSSKNQVRSCEEVRNL